MTLYFGENGFTMGDGPLRSYEDPKNAPFSGGSVDSCSVHSIINYFDLIA